MFLSANRLSTIYLINFKKETANFLMRLLRKQTFVTLNLLIFFFNLEIDLLILLCSRLTYFLETNTPKLIYFIWYLPISFNILFNSVFRSYLNTKMKAKVRLFIITSYKVKKSIFSV